MADNCDPCNCLEMYYRDSQSWRKAVIELLCDIETAIDNFVIHENLWDRNGTTIVPHNAGDSIATDCNLILPVTTSTCGQLQQPAGTALLQTYGTHNIFFGVSSGNFTLTGTGENTGVGYNTLNRLTTGVRNTAIGSGVLSGRTTGQGNTALGYWAGHAGTTGDYNVFLGYSAGQYETGSNYLLIDNQDRTDEAGGRANSLIVGQFSAVPKNQSLVVNAQLKLATLGTGLYLKEGADACAGLATLVNGAVTVATTYVSTQRRIQLTVQQQIGTLGFLGVGTIVNNVSFDIVSSNSGDNSVVYWEIIKPA